MTAPSPSEANSILTLLLLLAFFALSVNQRRIQTQLRAIARLDAKLDLLLKHAGVDYDPYRNLPRGVAEAVARGNKIEAIKLYRAATGVDLKDAKGFIEDIQRRAGT